MTKEKTVSEDPMKGNFRFVGHHAEEIEINGETVQIGTDQFTGEITLTGRSKELHEQGLLILLSESDPNAKASPFDDPTLPIEEGTAHDGLTPEEYLALAEVPAVDPLDGPEPVKESKHAPETASSRQTAPQAGQTSSASAKAGDDEAKTAADAAKETKS